MTTTHRIATGIVAALALASTAPASATPWDPNSRDPFIPIRPAPEPAMIAPAPSGRRTAHDHVAPSPCSFERTRLELVRYFAGSDLRKAGE